MRMYVHPMGIHVRERIVNTPDNHFWLMNRMYLRPKGTHAHERIVNTRDAHF
jgi:hypothetical protein